jgi:hypothetical protein
MTKPVGKNVEPAPEVVAIVFDSDTVIDLYTTYSITRCTLDVSWKNNTDAEPPSFTIGQRFSCRLLLKSGRVLSGINMVAQSFTHHANGRFSLSLRGPRDCLTMQSLTHVKPLNLHATSEYSYDY